MFFEAPVLVVSYPCKTYPPFLAQYATPFLETISIGASNTTVEGFTASVVVCEFGYNEGSNSPSAYPITVFSDVTPKLTP